MQRKTFIQSLLATALAAGCLGAALAQSTAPVTVQGAWARASVQGQKASGAFMTLTAKTDLKLVGASTPVAGLSEVHEMKMDGNVMTMRAVAGGLDLPAGKPVALAPGGYHVMLMDLKTPLAKDSVVPLTLTFKDAKGATSTLEVKLPVVTSAPGGKPMDGGMVMDGNMQKH
jgi:hypothetical protein